jgi:hypothetical protein
MDFNINRAARIMRIGNEFSETNKKLQKAIYSFIEWFFQALDGYELPGEEFGWIFRKNKENNQQIEVAFRMDIGGWHYVSTNSKKPQMNSIALLCQALAGPEGNTLLTWLEKQTQERSQLLVALESGIKTFRSSIAAQSS